MTKPLFAKTYTNLLFINSYYKLNLFIYEAYRTVFFFPEPDNKAMYFVIDTVNTLDDFNAFIIDFDIEEGSEAQCDNLTKVIVFICSLVIYKKVHTLIPPRKTT